MTIRARVCGQAPPMSSGSRNARLSPIRGDIQPLSRATLNDYVVTKLAIPADGLPRFTHLAAVVIAEAAAEVEMPDVVRRTKVHGLY
jgi:hypothetical protein